MSTAQSIAVMLHQNSQHSRVMNLKYKSKYKKLKKQVKDLVFENAALSDEVAQTQAELMYARDERRYLIKRLMRREGVMSAKRLNQEHTQQSESQTDQPSEQTSQLAPKKRGPKKRKQLSDQSNTDRPEKYRNKPRDKIMLDDNGKPLLPINLGNILIHSIGEIIPVNSNFHTAQWIYPAGYVATRIFAHPKDPHRKCVYTCKILNNAGMPQFQIIPDNDLDSVFFGESANICHQGLLENLQRSLREIVKLPQNVQGEKFFGLGNPTVRTLLQMDVGFKQCANFVGFPTTDSDFTLAEENDPTLSYEALRSLITMSTYHTMPEVREEPPDELLEVS